MNWSQLHHWFWHFPYQFCRITNITIMPQKLLPMYLLYMFMWVSPINMGMKAFMVNCSHNMQCASNCNWIYPAWMESPPPTEQMKFQAKISWVGQSTTAFPLLCFLWHEIAYDWSIYDWSNIVYDWSKYSSHPLLLDGRKSEKWLNMKL